MASFDYAGVFCPSSNFDADAAAPVEKLVISILEQPVNSERFMRAGFMRLSLRPKM
jgi:hypothetical protein